MRTGKRIAVLLLVFIAAVAIYFVWPLGHREENGVSATYTAMEEATLPVVYPTILGQEMAPLFGHREEKAVTAERGSLLVLSEDRRLPIRIEYGEQIRALQYEIRSMDMEHLVERTELGDWTEEGGEIRVELPIQNLLKEETEYRLGICASLSDGTSVWYYARVIERDGAHGAEMLALAEEFSQKTFHYDSAQDLTMYMESSPSADNSSFGTVTLKNSFTQMTWGSLDVERADKTYMTLKELSGDLANIQLDYYVTREEDGKQELYSVTENFTMKWSSQRIYMMDYQRTMNQVFTGSRDSFSGKRILLGISDGEDLYAKKSPGGQLIAFVVNRELWMYDVQKGRSIRVFAFGGSQDDVRANLDRHDVEVLEISDTGDVDFLVYGYMNRGSHEGATGISYNHYDAESNTLEEQFFLPAAEPFSELALDIHRLAHKGENGVFYLYMGSSVYGIDLKSHEYVVVASGLTGERFSVSADGSRLAWQENTGLYDSRVLHIMDLDTGDKTQLGDGRTNAYRILGFVGNDCIYGVGEYGDYITSNGRVMGLYLKSLDIVDRNMESAMHYEKSGSYIRDVKVDDSRIHLRLVRERSGGFFGTVSEDTLVCNAEALPGRMDDIGWYASEDKGRIYFVQLAKDIASSQQIKTVTPKKLVLADGNEIRLEPAEKSETAVEFYAYGRGQLVGSFSSFADAAGAVYDCMGFVTAGRDTVIWARANRSASYYIRDVASAVKRVERYRQEFDGTSFWDGEVLLLDGSGCTLIQALYFVGQNTPVLAYTGEGSFVYLTGYDQTHVRVLDPATGQTETMTTEAAAEYFDRLGNDYICCALAN